MSRYLGLTQKQTDVLGEIATGNALPYAAPATFRKLIEKGLIVRLGDKVLGRDRFGAVAIPQYEMPTPEHMRFCEWCSEQVAQEDPQ